jgi:hypothetical protein
MGKRKKEDETEEFVKDYLETYDAPVYKVSPGYKNEDMNSREEVTDKEWKGPFAICFVVLILVIITLGFNITKKDIVEKENAFYEAELNTFCNFYGYDRMYKDDVAVYCVEDNKAISLLKINARYLDYYFGMKKYDIRNYKISYKDCPEDVEMKYSASKQAMQVVC